MRRRIIVLVSWIIAYIVIEAFLVADVIALYGTISIPLNEIIPFIINGLLKYISMFALIGFPIMLLAGVTFEVFGKERKT